MNSEPLKKVCKIYNGNSINADFKKKNFAGLKEGYPFIATKDVSFNGSIDYDNGVRIPFDTKFKVAPAGSVFICAEGGSAGRKIARVSEPVCFGNKLFCLEPGDRINSNYLYHYLLSEKFQSQFKFLMSGLIGGVSAKKFGGITIEFPSPEEQAAIVAKLDTAFAIIESVKANNFDIQCEIAKATLSLFSSCFDFNSTPVEEKTLADIIDKDTSITYGIVQPGEDVKTGIPVVRPVDLRSKYIQLSPDIKRTTKEISDSYKRTILRGDEILICVRGTTGVVSFASESLAGGNVTRGIVPIKISDNLLRDYIYYWLQSPVASSYIESHTTGAALKQINIADMRKVPIFLPTKEKMREIVNILDEATVRLDCLSRNLEKCDAELSKFRQAVLQQIFE